MRLTIRLQSFLDEVRISRASGLERIFSKSALAFRLISIFKFHLCSSTCCCPVVLDHDGFTDGKNFSHSNSPKLLNSKFQIHFDCDSQQFDWLERMQFWDSMRPWFLARGYTIYDYEYSRNGEGQLEDIAYVYPSRAFEGATQYPYSIFGGDPPNTIDRPLSGQALVNIFTYSPCNTSPQLFSLALYLPKTHNAATSPSNWSKMVPRNTKSTSSCIRI